MISLGRSHALSASMIISGGGVIALCTAFLLAEARQANSVLPLDLLFRPALGSVALVGLLHNVGIYRLVLALSLAFQELRGMTPVGAGLLFLLLTLTLVAGTRVGEKSLHESDPFEPDLGTRDFALRVIALAVLGFDHSLIAIAIPLCVIGWGGGLTVPFEQRPADRGRHRCRVAGCADRRFGDCGTSKLGFRGCGYRAGRCVRSCGSDRAAASGLHDGAGPTG
jgi:hypothetical protein